MGLKRVLTRHLAPLLPARAQRRIPVVGAVVDRGAPRIPLPIKSRPTAMAPRRAL
eukprot:COSAG04_NODE_3802_length_2517_cov_1.544251_1_plen_54_part_10